MASAHLRIQRAEEQDARDCTFKHSRRHGGDAAAVALAPRGQDFGVYDIGNLAHTWI